MKFKATHVFCNHVKPLSGIIFLIALCHILSAQPFTGMVRKSERPPTAIYQATVEIKIDSNTVKILKTYFDGTFSFKPDKNRTYTVKISYPGYVDSVFTFTTDAQAIPSPAFVNIKLKKDGMRLFGQVRSKKDNFPIKGVTLVLKNIMTRQTDRITTDLDGKFNFKIQQEANYSFTVDKRSPGLANKYKDTTIYLSTLGVDRPVDFKMNLFLQTYKPVPLNKHRADLIKAQKNQSDEPEIPEKKRHITKSQRLALLAAAFHDSIDRVEEEKERELAAKKAYDDSVAQAKFIEQERKEFMDSLKIALQKPHSHLVPHLETPPLFFGKNSSEINGQTEKQLEGLATLLATNPTWRMHLYSLASADEENPEQIIIKRTDAVIEFLLKSGIAAQQVQALYYGTGRSRNDCVKSDCPEKQLEENRCAVCEIIKN